MSCLPLRLLLITIVTLSSLRVGTASVNNNNIDATFTNHNNAAWSFPPDTTAVVTGGTKGIGRAIVEELASVHNKCRVLTCARNPTEVQEFVADCRARGLDVHGVVADVSTAQGRSKLIEDIEAFLGSERRLDILVNNVGTNIRKPSVAYTQEELEFILNTNFNSMFGLTTACHKFLKRSPGTSTAMQTSSVVNIGSVAGVTCVKTGTPYSATKAAMNHVTGNWACEWGPDGIRVNCVTPWYV
jgi:Tropinone reductase 1